MRADKLYLATVQDRRTRVAAAVPTAAIVPPQGPGTAHGLGAEAWARAAALGAGYAAGGVAERVYADNGMGMAPAFGALPRGARTALALGATLVFIPPAQPWRNGRLERFHSRSRWCAAPTTIPWRPIRPT